MAIYGDPEWLYDEENMPPKIIVNSVLLILAAHHYYKGEYELAIPFFLIFSISILFHLDKKKEVLLDRIVMVFIFSHFFHTFYHKIPFSIFLAIGLASLLFWYMTDDRILYILYQLAGLGLFVGFYDISYKYKIPITLASLYLLFGEVLEKGWFHAPKHLGALGLGLLL
jgi:hypothetical protein